MVVKKKKGEKRINPTEENKQTNKETAKQKKANIKAAATG